MYNMNTYTLYSAQWFPVRGIAVYETTSFMMTLLEIEGIRDSNRWKCRTVEHLGVSAHEPWCTVNPSFLWPRDKCNSCFDFLLCTAT